MRQECATSALELPLIWPPLGILPDQAEQLEGHRPQLFAQKALG